MTRPGFAVRLPLKNEPELAVPAELLLAPGVLLLLLAVFEPLLDFDAGGVSALDGLVSGEKL